MQDKSAPVIETHHPATFRARGVAAPFTTPLLAGARVRSSRGIGLELVVPNPSGGRGVYVVRWPGVRSLCNPTVHDTMLFRRFDSMTTVNPASVRAAALDVAAQGYAGQKAVAAAEAAIDADREQQLRAHFLLMMRLIEQADPNGPKPAILTGRTPELDRRASAALKGVAATLGQPAAQLAQGVAALGNAFAPVGIRATIGIQTAGSADRPARIPRALARLDTAHADILRWLKADPDNDLDGIGQAVATSMRMAHDIIQSVLAETRADTNDPIGLLSGWLADPGAVIAKTARCDWLLDGWEHIGLLWLSAAADTSRRAAILEMAQLVPVFPKEIADWADASMLAGTDDAACKVVSWDNSWRTGSAAYALVQRNEGLRAMIS